MLLCQSASWSIGLEWIVIAIFCTADSEEVCKYVYFSKCGSGGEGNRPESCVFFHFCLCTAHCLVLLKFKQHLSTALHILIGIDE